MKLVLKAGVLVALSLCTTLLAGGQTPDRAPEAEAAASEAGSSPTPITLLAAIERGLSQDPGIVGAELALKANRALLRQARRPPNPELFVDLENAAGTGSVSGFDSAEFTAGVTQEFEVGGDRRARMRVANAGADVGAQRLSLARRELVRDVTKGYYELLADQGRLAVADSFLALASRFHAIVTEQVAAGKASKLDERRALVLVSNAVVGRSEASVSLAAAQTHLSVTLGDQEPIDYHATGTLESAPGSLDQSRLVQALEAGPHAMYWGQKVEEARGRARVVRSRRIPNVAVSLGGRRYRELGESALTGTIGIPIPVFDRRAGEVRAADLSVSVEEMRRDDALLRLRGRLTSLVRSVALTEQGINELRDRAIPAARANLAATIVGYREGKFDLTTVIDVERTLIELSMQLVDAQLKVRLMRADIDFIAAESGPEGRKS